MRHIWKLYICLGAILLMTACQAAGQSTFCDIAKPIIVEKSEISKLSNSTKRQILTHNQKGDQFCNWKPPR